ncbi:TonB-dependent receptor [Caulobacter soli]|uniref:TonB-dependent receptor n=1 Tax=Caulobacter soli TaxID=2708539 RepID=UPI0013EA93D7|nr:TonB-dependent receptor [Caulobacter soli]
MPFRRALAVIAAAGVPLAVVASPVQAAAAFHIPAQDARTALMALCLKGGCAFAFVVEPGRAYRTNAVDGVMSWRTAVNRMLAGTGLRHEFIDQRSVRIWAEASPPLPPSRAPSVDPGPAEVDAVTVTASFSEGIEASLVAKRRADAIIDSVSAGRMGELPAANLAEALQRVPGVAIEREVGEGQFVSVRGLGPLFQSVTLNGAPVAFNENIRNSTQSGRQFRFRALSADLLAGAVLAKSPTADLIDGGIGSNIDIRTVRGLDGPSYLSARIDGHIEERSGVVSPDVALSGRWRRGDGALGVVGGVSTETREVRYDRFQIQRWRDIQIGGRAVLTPNDLRTTVEREDRRRATAFAGLEWRPSNQTTIELNALASRFDNAIREDRIIYEIGDRAATPALEPASLVVTDGVMTAARLTAGQVSNNTEISDQAHDSLSLNLSAQTRLGAWSVTPRLSWSRARSGLDTPLQRIAAESPEGVGYRFDLGPDLVDARQMPVLDTTFDLTDPRALTYARYGVRATNVEDHDRTALLAGQRPVDIHLGPLRFERLDLGAQLSDRGRDYQRRDREAVLRPGEVISPGFFDIHTPNDVFGGLITTRTGPWTAIDFSAFRAAFVLPGEADTVIVQAQDLNPTGADLQNSYKVGEQIAALYGRTDFATTILGRPASGNLGLRVSRTRTRVEGSLLGVSPTGELEVHPVEHGGAYLVALPSANLAIELNPTWRLRLAASRSITRPSLADLRSATIPASSLVSTLYNRGQAEIDHPSPDTLFSGVGGNPDLKPYISTNLDASLERDFAGFGGFSLAAFHKTIDDYITQTASPERLAFATRAGPPVTATVMMARPRNTGRAQVSGVEIAFSRRFPGGLGVWTSATLIDAETRNRVTGEHNRLNGVSRLSYSISPFVERGPLHAHLSWTWRSSFGSEADMQGGGVSSFVVADAGYLDVAGSYDLGRSMVLFVEASNLTDTTEAAFEGRPGRPLQIGRAGRAFGVGFRMRL